MTSPFDWFLDNDSIGRFRAPTYTRHNHLHLEREADIYFSDFAGQLANANSDTRVLMAGWRFSPEQRLTPRTSQQGVLEFLLALANRKATVRVMVYGSTPAMSPVRIQVPGLPSKDNFDFVKALRDKGVQAFLDDRLAPMGSHHQKVVVIAEKEASGSIAYLGGIDFCLDRYDTVVHDLRPERQTEAPVNLLLLIPVPGTGFRIPIPVAIKTSQAGWHDVQAAVRGPAVVQIWQALVDRWNDPAPVRGPGVVPIPKSEQPVSSEGGSLAIQVLRTVPCQGIFRGLPRGEQTVRAAYLRAIEKAEHYIYIEDQYFWPSPVMDALRDAVARGVHVIAMVARDFDIPGITAVHKSMRARTAAHIRGAHPDRFHLFHKERLKDSEAIYVHSKLMFVDDVFFAVGTANVNWRSHTNDTELHLGVVDEDLTEAMIGLRPAVVGRQIRAMRQDLWAEHLDMSQAQLDDPIEALAHWPSRPGAKVGQAVWHDTPVLPGPPSDASEGLRLLLRVWQTSAEWPVLAAPLLANAGLVVRNLPDWGTEKFDLGRAVERIQDVSGFIEDHVLNPQFRCP